MNSFDKIKKLKEGCGSFALLPHVNADGDATGSCFALATALRKLGKTVDVIFDEFPRLTKIIDGEYRVYGGEDLSFDAVFAIDCGDIERLGTRACLFKGKTVCIDYSSINIAKPFHIGHLSTTVIGSALCKIFRFLGYKVVGINHLGDYGTQFGKLIYAYKEWGNREDVEKGRVKELMRLYVKFHDEAEKDDSLNDEARRYFKLIEDGDKESNKLFELFKKITLEEVEKIYKLLNVTFDSYAGESFYNDKMAPVVEELKDKGLIKISDGASIVDLEEYNMPPCLILKSDGSTLYATRDIAAAVYRKNTYDFDKCLYVVAYQQNLHFKQFFKVLELMGKDWAKDMVHVAYGMVSLEDGAMSTRHGKVVLLEDVIAKTIEKAYNVINEREIVFCEFGNKVSVFVIGVYDLFGLIFKIEDRFFCFVK